MRYVEDIKRFFQKSTLSTNHDRHEAIFEKIQRAQDKSKTTTPASYRLSLRSNIMKNRITKLTVAAVIIIAVVFGAKFAGGPNLSKVALGEVTGRLAQVDYVHVYWLKSRGDVLFRQFEAWYAHGKLVMHGKGGMSYDDGRTRQSFDEQGRRTVKEPSFFAEGQSFVEVFTVGLLSDKNEQLSRQMPTNVGDDVLIYEFDPPSDMDDSKWLESIVITVRKNSLLPVKMKIYDKEGDYDLVTFDYEATEKAPEFFEPPAVEPPHGTGEALLDGEEVVIPVTGAPGLKSAIVRLHDKSFNNTGELTFSLDVAFIIEEGYRSNTHDRLRLRLNEAKQCGVGKDWPDGKNRNIRFSPMLKPTDRKDTYIVEIWCWLRTGED